MLLRNSLKSLAWKSLFRQSGRRLRRRPYSIAPVGCCAAEVLEMRSLLSAGVIASAAGTAITVTSDSANDSLDIYRLNATTVKIDALGGTTINGGTTVTFPLSSVSGITVNLGSGFDTYNISNLNVGAGGILFTGAGGTGAALDVSNTLATPMTIGGDVVVRGATVGSALAENGPAASNFSVLTLGSGLLAINGLVSVAESGSGQHFNNLETNGSGGLSVGLGVTLNDTGSGGEQENISTTGSGSMTIGGSIAINTANSGTVNDCSNYIYTGNSGSITVGGSIAINATNSGAVNIRNQVYTVNNGGNIKVNGSISINDSGTAASGSGNNVVAALGTGSVTVGSNIAITDAGSQSQNNNVYTGSSGNVTVGSLITFTGFGTGNHGNIISTTTGSGTLAAGAGVIVTETGTGDITTSIGTNNGSSGSLTLGYLGLSVTEFGPGKHVNQIGTDTGSTGPVVVTGAVTVIDYGTGQSTFNIQAFSSGNVTINGAVTYFNGANTQSGDFVSIGALATPGNGTVKLKSALTLLLANDAANGNNVFLGLFGAGKSTSTLLSVNGPVTITSGAGADNFFVRQALFTSSVTIVTGIGAGATNESIEIDGAEFDGVVVAEMLGTNSQIHVNTISGFAPSLFKSVVIVIMPAAGSNVFLSNSTDAGTPVKFQSLVELIGGIPAGVLHIGGAVSQASAPILINFHT